MTSSAAPSPPSASGKFNCSQPLVTIVTPSFNQGEFIERTIRSVLCQDYPNIEYIVLDSASKDKTRQVLRRYEKHITRIVRERDDGQSFAINRGFAESSGEIMTWLNSDDCYASPSVVSQAVAKLTGNPDFDLIYGRRQYIDRAGYVCMSFPFREFSEQNVRVSDYLPQECCFWTRSIYNDAGGYVDTSFNFAMDYELFMRFLTIGAKFAAVNSTFGLFRYYDEHKSRVLWISAGIPEIGRIHEKYCHGVVSDTRMQANFVEHFFGVSKRISPRSYERYHLLREPFQDLAAQTRTVAPVDAWVFQREAVLTRRRQVNASTIR